MEKIQRLKSFSILLFAFTVWLWPLQVVEAQTPSQTVLEELAVYPSLIVYNAKIYTMDENLSSHQAMAIRGTRIWQLGTNDAIRRLAGPQTKLIDAKGRTVLPGLIDAHTHPHLWGMMHLGFKYDPQLQWLYVEGRDLNEVKSRLGESISRRIQQAGPDKWVITSIPPALQQAIAGGGITRADLDQIAPDTPVAVMTGIIGNTVTNTKAKQEMERVLGMEVSSLRIWYLVTYDIILKGKTEQASDLIAHEMEELLPFGVTTISSHIESPQVLRSANYLDRQGKMPVRWAWVHRIGYSLAKDPAEFYSLLGDFVEQGSEYFWNIGVGHEGWDNVPCTSAVPRTEELRDVQRRAAQNCEITPGTRGYDGHLAAARSGLRLANLHASSDRGLDAAIQIADQLIREQVMTLEEIKQQGWGFDHGTMVRPEQAALAAKYGFWMNFEARSITREETVLQNYGPDYLPWVSPVKTWLDAGARFFLQTDSHLTLGQLSEELMQDKMIGKALWGSWPDEWRNTIWPWLGAWITREINGKVFSFQKKLDRTTVMKAWTNWPAEYLLRPNDLGSLEPGKLADFIVIDKDYFSVPETEINNLKTLMTAVGGQVRFQAPEF